MANISNINGFFIIDSGGDATFSGNVGIGVTADASVRNFIKGSDDSTNNYQILTRNSSDANILAVRNDGNVGIGTTPITSPNGADTSLSIFSGQDCSIILKDSVETWEIYQNDDLQFSFGTTPTTVMTMQRTTGSVGIGTTSPASEANLSLGANSTTEGGHLVLFKGTSQTQATHLDNASNYFRIMNGADASSGGVQFSINHTNAAATFAGNVDIGGSTRLDGLASNGYRIYKIRLQAPYTGGWGSITPGTVIGGLQQTNFRTDGGASNIAAAVDFALENNTYGTGQTFISFKCGGVNGADSTEKMRITSGGDVLIGTTSAENPRGLAKVLEIEAGDACGIILNDSRDSHPMGIENAGAVMNFTYNTSLLMTILAGGNVGIGTTSPSSYYANQLVVVAPNESGITIAGSSTQKHYLCFADGTSGAAAYTGHIAYNHNDNSMVFATNSGAEKMRITSDGKIKAVGASPGGFYLDGGNRRFYGNGGGATDWRGVEVNSSGLWSWGETGIGNYFSRDMGIGVVPTITGMAGNIRVLQIGQRGVFSAYTSSGNVYMSCNVRVLSNGNNVAITSGVAGQYRIADDQHVWYSAATANAGAVQSLVTTAKIDNAGTFTAKGDVIAYGSPSDKRLKENIKPIESALDKVSKLQGVTFDWIQKEDQILNIKEDIGFIAQDVQKVIPELVRENEDGMLSMRHQGIAPILLEAIKELKAEIEELKNKPCNCK